MTTTALWSKFQSLGSIFIVAVSLSGCSTAIGAGAVVGVGAAQERGLEVAAIDTRLEFNIIRNWIEFNFRIPAKISIEVYEGRALLTGVLDKKHETLRADVVRLTWKVPGIKKVYDEIQIANSGVWDLTRDAWITAQLNTKVTFDQNIFAINYALETVNGIVYLIGIAQDAAELNRIKGHARAISYVRKVVSHVRLKNDRRL